MTWDLYDAAKLVFIRSLDLTCPNCGARADVDVIEVTALDEVVPQFAIGRELVCSAGCWREDPQKYIDAVLAADSAPPVHRPPTVRFDPEWIDAGHERKRRWWKP